MATKIHNIKDRDRVLKNNKVIILYSSDDCPSCLEIKPLYNRIAERYKDRITLAIVDTNELGMTFEWLPTFEVYHNGKGVNTMEGVDTKSLKQLVGQTIKNLK